MALIVNNNPASIAAQRNLSINTLSLNRSVERLSSGLRITRAADDAAGLGLSESLRAQIRSINQATRNASDGISLTQIADGAAATIGSLLTRLRELSSQSASGTVGNTERSYIDQEFVALRSEIDRIAQVTEFNGQALTSGSVDQLLDCDRIPQRHRQHARPEPQRHHHIVVGAVQCERLDIRQCHQRVSEY